MGENFVKKYSWNVDGLYKEDPEQVAQELEKISEITPDNVVEAAKNKESVLHNMFEWNDTIAGEKYRKIQARQIIGSIRVEVVSTRSEEEPKTVRAFVQTKMRTNYEPIETVVKDVDKYQLLLEKAYAELNRIREKYSTLEEIQELLKDIPLN